MQPHAIGSMNDPESKGVSQIDVNRGDPQQVQVTVILEHADEMHAREIDLGPELLQDHLLERGARRRRTVTYAIAAELGWEVARAQLALALGRLCSAEPPAGSVPLL